MRVFSDYTYTFAEACDAGSGYDAILLLLRSKFSCMQHGRHVRWFCTFPFVFHLRAQITHTPSENELADQGKCYFNLTWSRAFYERSRSTSMSTRPRSILIKDAPHGGFPKLGYPFGGPHNKDYGILESILGSPFLGETTT